MQKEQIQEFTSKITLSNRTGLTVVTYEILFVYLNDAKKVLEEEIPEIDLIVGVDEYDTIGDKLNELFNSKLPKTYDPLKRSLSNPLPVAYVKIGEGCSNKCAYCAIPLIRGDYYSYPKPSL